MFTIEVTYRTKLGNLIANMTTSQTVQTRDEAQELKGALKAMPQLADATIAIKNAMPLPTFDEAMLAFRKAFAEYPVDK